MVDVEGDRVGRGGQQVVGERAGHQGAGVVEDRLLPQRLRDALDEPAVHLPGDDQRVDDVADVVAAGVLAHRHLPGLGVHLDRAQVGPVREVEVHRVVGGLGVQRGLHVLGVGVRREGGRGQLLDGDALVGAADTEPPTDVLEVVGGGLEQVGRERPGLLDDLVDGLDQRLAADDEGARAVGVQALGRDLGVAVQDLDVLEGDAQPVGDDLAEGRLVALPVRGGAGDDLDRAGGEHPDAGVLPAAGAVVELAQHPRRCEPAHLGEGRDPDAELDPVTGLAALLLLGAQLVVAEHLPGPLGGLLVVPGVVLQPSHRGEGELVGVDPVAPADLDRVLAELGGQLVHQPLDGEGGLGTAGAAVGVGPGLVGQHRLAVEAVARELVDRVEHEGTEHRHATADDRDVGAEVREQLDLEAGDGAVLLGRQRELLPLVAAVVGGHQRLAAGLGELHRATEPASHREGDHLLRGLLQLPAEAATHVGGDHADLRLRDPGGGGDGEAQDVRHLGGRPDGDLLPGGVHDDGAGLHERGDQPLLAVLALQDDAVAACLVDGGLDVAAGAGVGGVEAPERRLVGAQVRVGQHGVLGGLLEVEGGRQLVVLHVDELGGVARLGGAAGHDDRHDLTGEGDPVGRHRQVRRGDLVLGDRPGVDAGALRLAEVGAGEDVDDVGGALGLAGVDRDDLRVGERAADHRQVQHPRERDVVGPAGAAGDEPLVLLAAALAADLSPGGCRAGRGFLDGGHAVTPCSAPVSLVLVEPAPAACCTALTMLW